MLSQDGLLRFIDIHACKQLFEIGGVDEVEYNYYYKWLTANLNIGLNKCKIMDIIPWLFLLSFAFVILNVLFYGFHC